VYVTNIDSFLLQEGLRVMRGSETDTCIMSGDEGHRIHIGPVSHHNRVRTRGWPWTRLPRPQQQLRADANEEARELSIKSRLLGGETGRTPQRPKICSPLGGYNRYDAPMRPPCISHSRSHSSSTRLRVNSTRLPLGFDASKVHSRLGCLRASH
jgi:hypothetical protein